MNPYVVKCLKEQKKHAYLILKQEDMSIAVLPTTYLKHKTNSNESPNTVKRTAFALSYYLYYLKTRQLKLQEVSSMPYAEQYEHFVKFLLWIKDGKHRNRKSDKQPKNYTCNLYLHAVFQFFRFLTKQYNTYDGLKIFTDGSLLVNDTVGVEKRIHYQTFRGYLKEEPHIGHITQQQEIRPLLKACGNSRDQLMLLLLAETGFRIGELLGIRYSSDIDVDRHSIRVYFREDNDNDARAKNAAYRSAKISDETFEFLLYYLSEYEDILKHTDYLWVTLSGINKGKALKVNAVYAMLQRLEEKTSIKATPHMLRHYFANQRRKYGWDIYLISQALGHKNIATTIQYLHLETDELMDASDKYYQKNKSLFMLDELL